MTHLSDLDIANQSTLQPIKDIAASVGISEDALEPYGHYKAKIDINKITPRENKGKVVLVTAMSPTPAGEGKSTVTVGLADAFHELNKNVMVALREPALGPTFGIRRWCDWWWLCASLTYGRYQLYTSTEISMRLQLQIMHCLRLSIIIFTKVTN
ncbi:formate--tetrahydrofolate ligase [Staphylococcus aureus]